MTPSNHPPNPPNTVGGEPLDAEGRAVQEMLGASRYRIRNVLGRGGMSTVWLADDLSAGGRPVAVKVLNRELGDDDEFRQRFRNEASAARSVDSPNVVAIYSHDEPGRGADGPCYIVMEQAVDEPVEAAVDGGADAGGDSAGHRASDERSPSARRLEEEGDIAADYVEELLDISDLDGDIDIEVRNGRTYVSVIAEEGDDRLRELVGRDGKGLEALQELVRLTVLSATGVRSRLVLDIAGHRVARATRCR